MKPAGWDNDVMDYAVSNLSYDKNGNIKSKDLMGPGFTANNVSTPASIDELTYTYAANSNRLTSVTDGITQNYGDGDFQDGHTSGADYAYDAEGNLAKDLNKGTSSVSYSGRRH